jgi:crossover junction endodeoxyribonuclease RuvC
VTGPTVIGLDLSMTSTGAALVVDGSLEEALTFKSSGKKTDSLAQTAFRLRMLWDRVVQYVADDDCDLVVIEAPSFGSTGGSQHERGGLWWMVASSIAVALDIPVAKVSPQGRAKYATGSGRASKEEVFDAACVTYGHFPAADAFTTLSWRQGNDMADAVILAAMGSRWLGYPIDELDSLPGRLSAIDGAHWPLAAAA